MIRPHIRLCTHCQEVVPDTEACVPLEENNIQCATIYDTAEIFISNVDFCHIQN